MWNLWENSEKQGRSSEVEMQAFIPYIMYGGLYIESIGGVLLPNMWESIEFIDRWKHLGKIREVMHYSKIIYDFILKFPLIQPTPQ